MFFITRFWCEHVEEEAKGESSTHCTRFHKTLVPTFMYFFKVFVRVYIIIDEDSTESARCLRECHTSREDIALNENENHIAAQCIDREPQYLSLQNRSSFNTDELGVC